VTIPQSQIHQLHRADADGGPAWNDSLVPETERLSLSDALDAGRAVAVRVPLMVRRRNVSPELSHFDLFVKRSRDGSSSAPLLLREGISIPEAKMKRVHGHAVLVVVDHSPLAALVGDAENPSHTQLLHEELKDKYVRGKMVLSLIRESSAGLVRALAGGSTEDDPFLFASLFPMSEAGTGRVQKPTTRPGHNAPKLAIETRSPARFRVNRVIGGFSIKGITETEDPPEELLISVAYEVRRGNPLKKYQPFDFAMSQGDIATVVDGAELKECRENRLRVVPQRSDFSVVVSGFDPNRNLFIRVN